MHIANYILLANLLFAGLANNSPNGEYQVEKPHQFDAVQKQALAQASNQSNECSSEDQSPPPGCGRRDS
jgi:hypothetical protein